MKRIVAIRGLAVSILAAAILAGCAAGQPESSEMPALSGMPSSSETPSLSQMPASSGAGEAGLVSAYSRQIYDKLSAQKSYPERDRRQAKVMVTVRIGRDGHVLARWAEAPLLFESFAREAEAMVDRAAPFPAVPEGIEGETFEFMVPVDYRLTEEQD